MMDDHMAVRHIAWAWNKQTSNNNNDDEKEKKVNNESPWREASGEVDKGDNSKVLTASGMWKTIYTKVSFEDVTYIPYAL